MEKNDIRTLVIKRGENGAFIKSIEHDWLRYLGFSDEEIVAPDITLLIQADFSKKHDQPFIGIAKKKVV